MLNLRKSSLTIAILSVLLLILTISPVSEVDSVNSYKSKSGIHVRDLHCDSGPDRIADNIFTVPRISYQTYGLEWNAFELEDGDSLISVTSVIGKANYGFMTLSYGRSA